MLKNLTLEDIDGGIEFIDIGASGGFPRGWQWLLSFINYYAFEPNQDECERLSLEANAFNGAKYFPFAVADKKGEATLYKTEDMFCYSLLEPNQPLLDRYTFGEKFRVSGQQAMQTVRLQDVDELKGVDVDILKVDSQGLDRRILEHGSDILDRVFYVEVEPGFNETYKTEDTYAGLDTFLRERGFRLFELTPHRVGRENALAHAGEKHGELIWAESVWMKDYVALEMSGRSPDLCRPKALKTLLICGVEGRLDFGLELAQWYAERGWITGDELASLSVESGWVLPTVDVTNDVQSHSGFLSGLLRLLPWSIRKKILNAAQVAVEQPHAFKVSN